MTPSIKCLDPCDHNLLKNAMDAVAEWFGEAVGGCVHVSAEVAVNKIVISIADNGGGPSKEHVLDVLHVEGYSTKTNGNGLGLKFVQQECVKSGFKYKLNEPINNLFVINVMISLY